MAVHRCFGLVSVHFLDWHQFMHSIFVTYVTQHNAGNWSWWSSVRWPSGNWSSRWLHNHVVVVKQCTCGYPGVLSITHGERNRMQESKQGQQLCGDWPWACRIWHWYSIVIFGLQTLSFWEWRVTQLMLSLHVYCVNVNACYKLHGSR